MARKLKDTPNAQNTAGIGDNSQAVEEASRVQFLSLLAQYDGALGELEIAKGPVKAAQKKLSSITGLAKAAGIPKWRLLQRHEEMSRPAFENAENIAAEARERRWAGIITPEQLKMHEEKNTPDEVRDAVDWRSAGYKSGVLGRAATLPEGMPARYTQDFLSGHEDGRKSYMLTLAQNAPKPMGMTAAELAAKAAADFESDEPEPGFYDEQRAEREAIRAAKASLENMERTPEEDGFESTAEELAAQTLRPSVQENEEPVV